MEQLALIGRGLDIAAAALLLGAALARLRKAAQPGDRTPPGEGPRGGLPGTFAPGPAAPGEKAPYWMHLAAWLVITAALALLVGLFLTDAFAFGYVAGRSSRALPWYYKVSAVWAGQEGSLLFWLWLQAGYGLIVARRALRSGRPLERAAAGVLSAISAFFAVVVAFVADPFRLALPAPADGAGMNPILQSYWMTAHPVMLYLGYVGLSVPFAYAVGALLYGDDRWVRLTRRWALAGWTFLSVGILFGARWAYEELGWGGYWGWDPVENASFMPWLVATAFIHSGIVQEKRGMLKRWNFVLVFCAYELTLFGTFLTRSGILASVHAFVESDISPWFIGFLGVVAAGFLYGLIARWSELEDERPITSPVSKESSFLANNVVFLATAFAIFWGTVFPLVASAFGRQVTVGTPYFERVTGPLFWVMLLLMGAGPLVAWRRATAFQLKRDFTAPLINAVLMAVWLWIMGLRERAILLSLPAAVFVFTSIVLEFVRGVAARMRSRKEAPWTALWRMMNRNPGRYGGYVAHLGVLFITVGIAASSTYQFETSAVLAVGEEAEVGPYRVRLHAIEQVMHGHVPAVEATLLVLDSGGAVGYLVPSKRFYPESAATSGPTTEAAVYGAAGGDLYAVLAGWEPFGSLVAFKLYFNPLVWLLWAGGLILIGGAVFSLWPRSRGALSESERVLAALAELEYDLQMGKIDAAQYGAIYAELAPGAQAYLKEEATAALRVVEELRERLPDRGGASSDKGARGGGSARLLALVLAAALGALGLAPEGAAEDGVAGQAPAPAGVEEAGAALLAVPSETLVVRWEAGELAVLDLVTVVNLSDAPAPEVRLPLPRAALDISTLPEGLEVIGDPLSAEVVDRAPLGAGEERRYTLQYRVPVFRWPFALRRQAAYPTARLLLLVQPGQLEAGGIDLLPGPVEELAGQRFQVYESLWIDEGVTWQAMLRPAGGGEAAELPVLGAADRFFGHRLAQWARRQPAAAAGAAAALAAVLVAAAVRRRLRARGRRSARRVGEMDPASVKAALEGLIRGVARLDIAYREGALATTAYLRRRGNLLDAVQELLGEDALEAARRLAEIERELSGGRGPASEGIQGGA